MLDTPGTLIGEMSSGSDGIGLGEKASHGVKGATSSTNTKTIKAPGTRAERTAQACDRCRAKKIKCDGKLPSCSSCASVGIKCIVSDKLSRRAFPKGYTETLEERIRQLEAENKKLTGLLDLRDEQISTLNCSMANADENYSSGPEVKKESPTARSSILSKHQNHQHHKPDNGSHEQGCPCGCTNYLHSVHERPVSIVSSIYDCNTDKVSVSGSLNLSDEEDNNSLLSGDELFSVYSENVAAPNTDRTPFHYNAKQNYPAAGAFAAATAIARMQRKPSVSQPQTQNDGNKKQLLTSLVAMSIPRSTEETLFIPTFLSKLCQVYGYRSKQAVLSANSLASLKETATNSCKQSLPLHLDEKMEKIRQMIMNKPTTLKLESTESIYLIKYLLEFPRSRIDFDQLITFYFQDWGNALPILNKNSFLKSYMKVLEILESPSETLNYETTAYESIEKFVALLVLVLSLSLLSSKTTYLNKMGNSNPKAVEEYNSRLKYYDILIHEFIKPNCVMTQFCSIQSLQILSLALEYCLFTGDICTCYELRGRAISMAQQLRLHRCPAAVLGIAAKDGDNVNLQNYMQGERRILFWCIYCLDIYSSFSLGVPRLLKDFEIECAMPFAGKVDDDDENDNENILIVNNTKLSIVGKVSKLALSVMLYCKVLGSILDSIFYRFERVDEQTQASEHERELECWRRELPADLRFDLDINSSLSDDISVSADSNIWQKFSNPQMTLIFMYFHARILIYLTIVSKYGNHLNVGLSQKEQILKGKENISTVVSSMSIIQQTATKILTALKFLNASCYVLPIPVNIVREQSRFALLVAKGTLDYIKGGSLFQHSRSLLRETVAHLCNEGSYDVPGSLSKNTAKLLELAIPSILGINVNKVSSSGKKRHSLSQMPISKPAVTRNSIIVSKEKPQNRQFSADDQDITAIPNNPGIDTAYISNKSPIQSQNTIPNAALQSGLLLADGSTWTEENLESIDNILKFDPFKASLNSQFMLNEFAADGSLGLVPFLEMNNASDNDSTMTINNASFGDYMSS
ncbi:Piso0_002777 [Millerozyma farinosa CBS 7064]|uniref:Piso0_002777 protein n=1 Tax=Pichia sorbitophila (strain ATCC MYA-4447 / BCRC 22081 / CBS 7064 / NBRC 10061 / NRRL Y-12695) TaxID=559304 RepID=G8YFY2_PICSO|nr:Piso0_002777 [Millerozyma farinosa CBS 7064]